MYTAVKFVDLRNEEEIMYSTSVVIVLSAFYIVIAIIFHTRTTCSYGKTKETQFTGATSRYFESVFFFFGR